jgi:hypothetical protein
MAIQISNTMPKKLPLTLISTALIGWASQVQAMTLGDVELAFLLDGSDSVSAENFNLQLQAYENIFRDNFYETFVAPLLGQNINGSVGLGRIAVAAFQFGGVTDDPEEAFQTIIDWTEISDQTGANQAADGFENVTQIGGFTPLGLGIEETAISMFNNIFRGAQLVMDISSDGLDSPQDELFIDPIAASDFARCAGNFNGCPQFPEVAPGGVNVINAIATRGSNLDLSLLEQITYGTNLSGDPATVFLADNADNIEDYQEILWTKISAELIPPRTPEPSLVLAMVTLGLVGVATRWTRGDN